jgi:hypothetical protein
LLREVKLLIEKAAALAKTRGWDFAILSPLQLSVAIPSPRWRFYHTVDIFCSIDAGAWGFVSLKEFDVVDEREPELSLAVDRLRQFFTPDEIDILPAPQCLITDTFETSRSTLMAKSKTNWAAQ